MEPFSLEGAADNLAEVMERSVRYDGARLQLCHVEQVGNEAIEPFGFVDNCCQQIGLLSFAEFAGKDRDVSRNPVRSLSMCSVNNRKCRSARLMVKKKLAPASKLRR